MLSGEGRWRRATKTATAEVRLVDEGLGVALDFRVEEGSLVDGSPSGEVQWFVPRSGIVVDDLEDVEGDDDEEVAVSDRSHRSAAADPARQAFRGADLLRFLGERDEGSDGEYEAALRGELEKCQAKAGKKRLGATAEGGSMSGVGRLSDSDGSRRGPVGGALGKPSAARRLPVESREQPRDPREKARLESTTARTPGSPVKKVGATRAKGDEHSHMAMGEVEFKEWLTHKAEAHRKESQSRREEEEWASRAEAARQENRLEREKHSARRMEVDEAPDYVEPRGGRSSAWKEWEDRGGPYREFEGPVGDDQRNKGQGSVKLALDEARERDSSRERERKEKGTRRGREDSPPSRRRERVDERERSLSRERRGGRYRKETKPEKFDGTTSVEAFLKQFGTCARYNG